MCWFPSSSWSPVWLIKHMHCYTIQTLPLISFLLMIATHTCFPPYLGAMNLCWSACMHSTGIKKPPLGFSSVNSQQELQWCRGSSVCSKCQCFLCKSPLLLSDDMRSFSLLLHFSEASFAHLQVAHLQGLNLHIKLVCWATRNYEVIFIFHLNSLLSIKCF